MKVCVQYKEAKGYGAGLKRYETVFSRLDP
jgi:hypothetical protein